MRVMVNGLSIDCDGAVQTILIFVAVHLAFNLMHMRRQEATLETLEGLLHLRKVFTKGTSKNFLNSINLI